MTELSGVTMQLKNEPKDFHLLLLAKDDPRHQETQEILPTAKKIYKQEDTISAAADSGLPKPLSSS
jgi:hypothetical protein